jgi:hypothetical protein
VTQPLQVLGVGLWPTARAALEAEQGPRAGYATRPDTQLLAARARGRASLLTLMFAHVVEQATRGVGVDRAALPSVFGSAYGEMTTTLTLLEMLHSDDARLSPAKFQASVHNTAAGTLSIAQGNRSFSTSIAAGYDTVAMALLEAQAWLQRRPGMIVVACADEAAPQVLMPNATYDAVAMALLLSNVACDQPPLARLGQLVQTTGQPASGEPENPCAAGADLARAVWAAASIPQQTVVLNRSSLQTWQIDVFPSS